MKKTMLTADTLDRFEAEFETACYCYEEIKSIEHSAYVANMNKNNHPDWTEDDIYKDFLRVLKIHRIHTFRKEENKEALKERVFAQKKRVTRRLEQLLRSTDSHCKTQLEYKVLDDGEEYVEITYENGWRRCACVTADSDIALIRDVMKVVGY